MDSRPGIPIQSTVLHPARTNSLSPYFPLGNPFGRRLRFPDNAVQKERPVEPHPCREMRLCCPGAGCEISAVGKRLHLSDFDFGTGDTVEIGSAVSDVPPNEAQVAGFRMRLRS